MRGLLVVGLAVVLSGCFSEGSPSADKEEDSSPALSYSYGTTSHSQGQGEGMSETKAILAFDNVSCARGEKTFATCEVVYHWGAKVSRGFDQRLTAELFFGGAWADLISENRVQGVEIEKDGFLEFAFEGPVREFVLFDARVVARLTADVGGTPVVLAESMNAAQVAVTIPEQV